MLWYINIIKSMYNKCENTKYLPMIAFWEKDILIYYMLLSKIILYKLFNYFIKITADDCCNIRVDHILFWLEMWTHLQLALK